MPTGFEVETKVPENISTVSADFGAEMIDFDDTTHDAARIYFEIDTDNTFPDPVQLDSSADLGLTSQNSPSFKSADGLQPDTDYFVRAQAKNVVFSDSSLFTDADADSVGFREDIVSDQGAMTNLVASQDGMSKVMARSGFMDVFWDFVSSGQGSSSLDFFDADGGYLNVFQEYAADSSLVSSSADIVTDVDVSAPTSVTVDWESIITGPLDNWRAVSSMTTYRYSFTSSVVNSNIYAIGGRDQDFNRLDTVEKYDPGSDSWSAVSSMPAKRYALASEVVGGKIYAIGGRNNSYEAVDTVYEYDPGSDSWSTVSSMPAKRGALASEVVDGEIYAIGGDDGNNNLNTVEKYDPGSDSWSAVSSMPTNRYGLASEVVDGEIYAIGGFDNNFNPVGTVEKYDPGSDSWSTVSSMPTNRENLTASVVDGEIYAAGGEDADGAVNTVEVLGYSAEEARSVLNIGGKEVATRAIQSRTTETFDISSISGVSNISLEARADGVDTSSTGTSVELNVYDIYLS